jgi:coenzyme F420-0:L-glutamate ligase
MHAELIPIRSEVKYSEFDLFPTIVENIERHGEEVRENDVIVISSKFVAMSQGSVIRLSYIEPTEMAYNLSRQYNLDARLAEVVLQESDYIFNGIEGFILAVKDGVMAPNAGIDKSNVPEGYVILHPKDPFSVARQLREKFIATSNKKVGILIVDSRLMPTRIGTIGVALAVAGFEPVEDLRGKKDLFGNTLRVTLKATADSLATAANLIMGESNEAIPIVIARNFRLKASEKAFSWRDVAISHDQCIYVRGLMNHQPKAL